MAELWWNRRPKMNIPVERVKASRAIYISPDVQKIEMEVWADGQSLVLDMTSKQAAELIQQLSAAYMAINPPLRFTPSGYAG